VDPEHLLRFVADPEGVLTPDLSGRLPGRGVWVAPTRDSVASALRRNTFSRGLKRQVGLPEGEAEQAFLDRLASALRERALAALGLARRAGKAAAGFDQARAAILGGRTALVLTASDAAADGAAKLARLAAGKPVYRGFTIEEQSMALGRDSVVHIAIAEGAEAERLQRDIARLDGFSPVVALGVACEE